MSGLKNVLTLCVVITCAQSVNAATWPAFRGPTRNGHAAVDNLPVEWSATKNIVWKKAIPGEGWSSPVAHEGHVYVTSAVPLASGEDLSLRLYAIGADTGEVRSYVEAFQQDGETSPNIHQKNSHASPTPIVHDNKVFVHFGHQGTACIDLQGNIVWQTRLHYDPVHGNGSSPIVVGDKLIFSCDGEQDPFVVALDIKTGEIVWKTTRETDADRTFSFSTPTLITVNDKPQVISAGSNVVCAYDPTDGREIWRVRYNGFSVIPTPVYGHDLVFVCTGYGRPNLLAIKPTGQGDVTRTHIAWSTNESVPHTPSLLLVGDNLFMVSDNGTASCLDARTGKLHWRERLGGNFSASPLLAGDKIYFQDEDGKTSVIKASTTFKRLATNAINERTLASHAVAHNAIFLRSENHLYRIEAE